MFLEKRAWCLTLLLFWAFLVYPLSAAGLDFNKLDLAAKIASGYDERNMTDWELSLSPAQWQGLIRSCWKRSDPEEKEQLLTVLSENTGYIEKTGSLKNDTSLSFWCAATIINAKKLGVSVDAKPLRPSELPSVNQAFMVNSCFEMSELGLSERFKKSLEMAVNGHAELRGRGHNQEYGLQRHIAFIMVMCGSVFTDVGQGVALDTRLE